MTLRSYYAEFSAGNRRRRVYFTSEDMNIRNLINRAEVLLVFSTTLHRSNWTLEKLWCEGNSKPIYQKKQEKSDWEV